jgi:hypothetical protein
MLMNMSQDTAHSSRSWQDQEVMLLQRPELHPRHPKTPTKMVSELETELFFNMASSQHLAYPTNWDLPF